MENKRIEEAAASVRDVDNHAPSAEQDCSDVIHISVFFDGTGNNKAADEGPKRWSNPARMWRLAQLRTTRGVANYPIYISGVGTAFNGKALSALDGVTVKVEDEYLGGATGAGGTRRLGYGQQKINDALRKALLSRAQTLGGQVQRYAQNAKQQSFQDVNRSLAKHRLIKQINVSIFGFSRGAALARAFCNQWLWECENNRGKMFYEGHPIRFVFLGLFDTVASFGLPATNMSNTVMYGGFKGRDLVVDDRVERCVHYVAAHELRFSFPVDLIRKDGQLHGRWVEKVYPGVHSDVGGGYEPFDQDIDNNYSRIPMRDMIGEAVTKGTRMVSYDTLSKDPAYKAMYEERYQCRPATLQAYAAYTAACNPRGKVEDCVRAHMRQLYSAYGTLKRRGGENVTERQHRQGKSWLLGPRGMAAEVATYERLAREMKSPAVLARQALAVGPAGGLGAGAGFILGKGAYTMWIKPQDWQLQAWRTDATSGVMGFIHTFVHDSKVGFLNNAEPFSYFSQRGISESSRSVYGWLEYNVTRPVDHAVESTVDYASEKAEQAKKAAQEAAEKAKRTAKQAADYAAEKAEQARKAAEEAARKAQESARQAADYASRKAQQAQQAARAAAQKASNAASQVKQTVGKATQSALDKLDSAWNALWD